MSRRKLGRQGDTSFTMAEVDARDASKLRTIDRKTTQCDGPERATDYHRLTIAKTCPNSGIREIRWWMQVFSARPVIALSLLTTDIGPGQSWEWTLRVSNTLSEGRQSSSVTENKSPRLSNESSCKCQFTRVIRNVPKNFQSTFASVKSIELESFDFYFYLNIHLYVRYSKDIELRKEREIKN